MGFRLPRASHAKQMLGRVVSSSRSTDVPKGYMVVYAGEACKERFVVPISYLNYPSFQDLLAHAEQEFGFDHPMGGLTIPYKVEYFVDLTHSLS